ncbi:hypothetical protein ACFVWG_09300 [Kribbella sp. NPDC058245]|uniref:hypothetical protein n=1 Tax=Kribbella sp. NPDC058245 TaxID=3346399 RepID=UPI0036E2DD6A
MTVSKLVGTDPQVAADFLQPALMQLMRTAKVHTRAIVGDDLLVMEHPIFGRTKPDDVVVTLGKIMQLVGLLPFPAQR